MMEMFMP